MTPTERERIERQLAAALSRLGMQHRRLVLDNLGDPPRFENIPNEIWDKIGKEDGEALRNFLGEAFEQAALRLMSEPGMPSVDAALITSRAADFLARYTFRGPGSSYGPGIVAEDISNILMTMSDTTRDVVRKILQAFFNDPEVNFGELRKRLTTVFGPARAEMIARTEVTRAVYQGELAVVREVAQQFGLRPLRARWITDNDDLVCPICAPLHRTVNVSGDVLDPVFGEARLRPPAHPRCRCTVVWEYTDD